MLKNIKQSALRVSRTAGVFSMCLRSNWRRQRLLILCYHGVSLDDEHRWNQELYVPADFLERRFELLRRHDATILPLTEALESLAVGTLPPRAVAVTFDDGNYDFFAQAYPVLERFQVPATVYLTTYYSEFNRPVFDPMCDYLLWKAAGAELVWPTIRETPWRLDETGRADAGWAIRGYAARKQLSGQAKDELLAELAARLGISYKAILDKRLLHIMTPGEAAHLAGQGLVNLQLHTHRHRVSRDRGKFSQEIEDNRRRLEQVAPGPFVHFCYPGGFHLPEFEEWLPELGVHSATTCEVALASQASHPMLLPRLVDHGCLSEVEFEAWVSGVAQFLPQRPFRPAPGQLMEDQPQ